ncbi:unnamed protein product [Mucor hiemalis]
MENLNNINNSTSTDTGATDKVNSSTGSTRKFDKDAQAQRNDVTRRVTTETLRVLKWENPVRTGVIFSTLVGSILLTQSYSLLQIVSSGLSIAIFVNLVYVCGTRFFQTVVADHPPHNPYAFILENNEDDLLNKENAVHYSSIAVDIAETIARALTRIIFIEDPLKSTKWFGIFFTTWRISAYVPSRIIILFIISSAFIVPRLYISNKDLIDARIQQGQAILNTQLKNAQDLASAQLANVKGRIHEAKNTAKDATTANTTDAASATTSKKAD